MNQLLLLHLPLPLPLPLPLNRSLNLPLNPNPLHKNGLNGALAASMEARRRLTSP